MKNDPEFNIRFVKVVEKHPQLYNYTLEAYNNKQEVDKAWRDVAAALNESVINVVAKWATLRNNFNRSLRESAKIGGDPDNKKCYYLAQYMQFLLPYLKSRHIDRRERKFMLTETECSQDNSQTVGRDGKFENSETDYSQEKPAAAVSEEEISVHDHGDDSVHEEDMHFISTSEPSYKSRPKTKKFMPYSERIKHPMGESKRSPDVAFFESLLPIVENLNDSEKLRFRIGCMQKLQQIVDKVEVDLSSVQSVTVPISTENLRNAQMFNGSTRLPTTGVNLKIECNNPLE